MTNRSHKIFYEQDWARFWPEVLQRMGDRRILALEGDLGAGKTTFVKTIAAALGVQEEVTSPTYSIVQEYVLPDNMKLYHFDLYRLNSMEELLDLDFEGYLDSGQWVIIEWPQLAEGLLPPDRALWLRIEHLNEPGRGVVFL